jgi:hypothetical protein
VSTCPHCAQQRYPDSPWSNEDHPLWMLTEVGGIAAMIREHDGVVRILGPQRWQTPRAERADLSRNCHMTDTTGVLVDGTTRPLLHDISASCDSSSLTLP